METEARPEPPPARGPRWKGRLLLGSLLLIPLTPLVLNSCFSAPTYRGPLSDHFDGAVFRNQVAIEHHGLMQVLEWRLRRDVKSWEGYAAQVVPGEVPERVQGDALRVTFVGHATVLLQTAGLNVLTDPVWSERVSPVSWAGPKRHVPPGVAFDDLPPIDLVLVSHNHYDHLDLPSLRRLAQAHAPAIYLPLGNTALLEQHGIAGGRDLDWWERVEITQDVSLSCVPAQHFSGRWIGDRDGTLWGGFVLETPGGALYFAGDTGVGPHFEEVRERFGAPRLALLPIGAYLPSWFMQAVHTNPREAAQAHLTLGAAASLGIHFGCFELADDGPRQPALELEAAREELGIPAPAFRVLEAGEAWDLPRGP